MPGDHGERLSKTEARVDSLSATVVEIRQWLEKSSTLRTSNHNEVIKQLATIVTKQDEFNRYQQSCDKDRGLITGRVTALERGESRAAGKTTIVNAGMAAAVSLLVAGVAAFFTGGHHGGS